MLIKFDIESELYRIIDDLVRQGKYQDIYQFIKIALTNQAQEELSGTHIIEQKPSPKFSSKISQIDSKTLDEIKRKLSDMVLEESQITFPSHDLIWSFYNRFFPVKLVVRQLATLINPQNVWVEINQIQDASYWYAEQWSSRLRQYEEDHDLVRNEKLSTGLPTPLSEISKARGFQKRKVESKIMASKIRFLEQFLGRPIKKDPPHDFKGACFDMALMGVRVEEKKCHVTLTDQGMEFALLENPIIDRDQYDHLFSSEEIDFIFNKIIPRFKLENTIVNKILNALYEKELTSDEIDKIFEDEKLHYYQKKKPIGKKEIAEFQKEIVRERIATMGRLSEIRKVKWQIDNYGKSRYSLN